MPVKFAMWVFIAVATASLFEIVPMFLIKSNVPTINSVKPYTPLELAGRDIYVAEGCYNCHSQMIRQLFADTKRFGESSKPGESVYDHPFQWGSRRIGPDLAREGKTQTSGFWHIQHFFNPEEMISGSIMPRYLWLFTKKTNFEDIQGRVDAMAMLGVPYGKAINEAPEMAREQSRIVAAKAVDEAPGGYVGIQPGIWETINGKMPSSREEAIDVLSQKQVIAVIAYLQRLGTDLEKPDDWDVEKYSQNEGGTP